MRRSIGPVAVLFAASYICSLPSHSQGLAQPGASVAVFDFFNLSGEATYDEWESLFGRGLRRGLFTHKEVEVVPYPALHKALSDLQVDDYFITPEQIPPIGTKVDGDLAILGSFNVEEGVIACSLKVVDAKSGKVLAEDIRFGSKDQAETFLRELETGLEKILFGEAGVSSRPGPDIIALQAPSTGEVEQTTPELTAAEESPWSPITQVAPVGSPVGAPIEDPVEPASEQPAAEPEPSVSLQGPSAPSDMVDAEDAGAESFAAPPAPEPVPPVQPPQAAPLQNVLNDAWKRSTGATPAELSQGTVSPPQYPSTALPQPGAAFGNATPPAQTAGDPFAPMVGQPAPPMRAQPQPLQSFPQQPPYQTSPGPIEAQLPPLQPPPRVGALQSPFQPMSVTPAPPPQQVQQYPYVPPAPSQIPQEPARRGPIGRFFGWMGRAFGRVDSAPTDAPQPQSAAPPPQQGQNPNLWMNGDQQSNASPSAPGSEAVNGHLENRILVASLPPQPDGIVADVPPSPSLTFPELPTETVPLSAAPLAEKPFEPKGLAGWAKTYFDAGNYDLAKDAYKKAALDNPKNPDLFYNLAQAQLASGEEDAALKSLERVAELRPNDQENLIRLGSLYAKRKEWGRAIDTYTSLALAAPSDPEAFNKLGMAFDQGGRPREALRAFRKALALDPKNAHAAYHASDVFQKLNRPHEAQAYAQLAKSLL